MVDTRFSHIKTKIQRSREKKQQTKIICMNRKIIDIAMKFWTFGGRKKEQFKWIHIHTHAQTNELNKKLEGKKC